MYVFGILQRESENKKKYKKKPTTTTIFFDENGNQCKKNGHCVWFLFDVDVVARLTGSL